MVPAPKKSQNGQQKKKYNEFRNSYWKKKTKTNENSLKSNRSHVGSSNAIKFVQTPISKYYQENILIFLCSIQQLISI